MLTEVIRVRLELDSVYDQIVELCRRYGIAELGVFGSVARGEDRPDSEVNLLYVRAPDSTGSLWELWELRDEPAQLLGRKVDLIPKDNLLWDVTDRTQPRRLGSPLTGHTGAVTAMALAPDVTAP